MSGSSPPGGDDQAEGSQSLLRQQARVDHLLTLLLLVSLLHLLFYISYISYIFYISYNPTPPTPPTSPTSGKSTSAPTSRWSRSRKASQATRSRARHRPSPRQTTEPLEGVALLMTDFFLQPPKSGFNTVRLVQVRTHRFSRQAHGATLGRIFIGF